MRHTVRNHLHNHSDRTQRSGTSPKPVTAGSVAVDSVAAGLAGAADELKSNIFTGGGGGGDGGGGGGGALERA